MLKKLFSALALTGLAFGSGLCFNPYNHDYGFIFKGLGLGLGNKRIVLHNGKVQLGNHTRIKLTKYTVNGNKALMLMRGMGMYFVVYTKCIQGKPITKDAEVIGEDLGVPSASVQVVNDHKYPIKFGFYKDGFWVKGLVISWIQHLEGNGPGGNVCDYETKYYPYELIKEHKGYEGPVKNEYLPTRVCNPLAKKLGI